MVEELRRGETVKGVSFTLHGGEVLGFAGLVGAGRTETARLIFGADRNKGLRMSGTHLEVIELGNGLSEGDVLIHDETDQCLAFLLSQLTHPEFPEPIGVIYSGESREPYEAVVTAQMREAIETKGPGDLKALLHEGETWIVDPE